MARAGVISQEVTLSIKIYENGELYSLTSDDILGYVLITDDGHKYPKAMKFMFTLTPEFFNKNRDRIRKEHKANQNDSVKPKASTFQNIINVGSTRDSTTIFYKDETNTSTMKPILTVLTTIKLVSASNKCCSMTVL